MWFNYCSIVSGSKGAIRSKSKRVFRRYLPWLCAQKISGGGLIFQYFCCEGNRYGFMLLNNCIHSIRLLHLLSAGKRYSFWWLVLRLISFLARLSKLYLILFAHYQSNCFWNCFPFYCLLCDNYHMLFRNFSVFRCS